MNSRDIKGKEEELYIDFMPRGMALIRIIEVIMRQKVGPSMIEKIKYTRNEKISVTMAAISHLKVMNTT